MWTSRPSERRNPGKGQPRFLPFRVALFIGVACVLWSSAGQAQPVQQAQPPIRIDRVIARFEANELGGPAHPRFIFERTLAFEARLEALAEMQRGVPRAEEGFTERDVRAALERHVTEQILVSLPVEPPLQPDEVLRRTIAAYVSLQEIVGGRQRLLDAAFAEGMEMEDLNMLVERRARASLYLDRMVAPMLNPSNAELREVLRTESTPYRGRSFEDVAVPLRQWYLSDRLRTALAAFFRSARARIRIVMLHPD